jgi:hypothetical protein
VILFTLEAPRKRHLLSTILIARMRNPGLIWREVFFAGRQTVDNPVVYLDSGMRRIPGLMKSIHRFCGGALFFFDFRNDVPLFETAISRELSVNLLNYNHFPYTTKAKKHTILGIKSLKVSLIEDATSCYQGLLIKYRNESFTGGLWA